MILTNLTIAIKGAVWMLYTVEVENINVTGKWVDDHENGGGTIALKDVTVSDDDVLDVFISLGAPNGTQYTVVLSGKTKEVPAKSFTYSEDFKVVKNGKLKIVISKTINDLING